MSVRRLAPKEKQPESFAFSAENLAWAKKQIAQYPAGRQASAAIAILWRAQEQNAGWISEAAIRAVADLLDMPYIRMLEIATFYTMFQLQPVGRKAHIQVCGTTPCRLRGAEDILEVCKSRIHHEPFHLSKDGDFSWEEVECLGACVNAPMVLIWKDTYEDLTKENFGKVLDGLDTAAGKGEGGRRASAQPALTDADAKKPTDSASRRESPTPKPPADDATRKGKT
jgi:NADH-quinone oxidoreductase subunit E